MKGFSIFLFSRVALKDECREELSELRSSLLDAQDEEEKIIKQFSEEVDNGYGVSHYRQLKNIYQTYKVNKSNNVPFLASQCLHTLKLIHSIYVSVEKGRRIHLSENLSSNKLGL